MWPPPAVIHLAAIFSPDTKLNNRVCPAGIIIQLVAVVRLGLVPNAITWAFTELVIIILDAVIVAV